MINIFFGNAIWHLVKQADVVSKLVLLILMSMSVICWAIFFYKLILFRVKRSQLRNAINLVKDIDSLDVLLSTGPALSRTMPGYFLSKNLTFLKTFLTKKEACDKIILRIREWELVRVHMDQTIDDLVINEESYLSVLSTCAVVSPLLGLFGTVWGLVHAFIRISELQAADITTVAPGIAEALMTTLAGLMVAIPVLILFNYLSSQVRGIEQQLVTLADKVSMIIQRLCINE